MDTKKFEDNFLFVMKFVSFFIVNVLAMLGIAMLGYFGINFFISLFLIAIVLINGAITSYEISNRSVFETKIYPAFLKALRESKDIPRVV